MWYISGMNKIIVAGSRNFQDYTLLKQKLDHILKNLDGIEIVSGNARGVDRLGERYAQEKRYRLKLFPANWAKYGKSAGYRKNLVMQNYATHVVCFWDGKSKGTKHMIDISKNLLLRIARI